MDTKFNQFQASLFQILAIAAAGVSGVVPHARVYTRGRTQARVGMSLFGLLIGATMLFSGVASAATQGYVTKDSSITKGMAVAIATDQSGAATTDTTGGTYVEKSSVSHANRTLGVVVDPATDVVSTSVGAGQVYVATSGSANVYVTDLNGTVKKGSLLAPSPMAGILMRANDGTRGVLGVAVDDFPTKTAQTSTIKDENGNDTKVKVALQEINMDVKFATNTPNAGKSLLQRIGEAVVHHEVSSVQVIVALVILCILLLVEGSIIYGAISSSIASLGRNPLARKTIMKGLGQISVLVGIILGLGIAAVYLVLWI